MCMEGVEMRGFWASGMGLEVYGCRRRVEEVGLGAGWEVYWLRGLLVERFTGREVCWLRG